MLIINSIDIGWTCKNMRDMIRYLQTPSTIYVQSLISIFKTDISVECVACRKLS